MFELKTADRSDIARIFAWIKPSGCDGGERRFLLWSFGRIAFPPTPDSILQAYGALLGAGRVFMAYDGETPDSPIGSFAHIESGEDGVKLGYIVVDPAVRGKGYGRRLVESACAELFARGEKRVRLSVFAENAAARRCYGAVGFKETGRRIETLTFEGSAAEFELIDMAIETQ